jgi:ATP-dependent Clp protease adaptor protein ClpS
MAKSQKSQSAGTKAKPATKKAPKAGTKAKQLPPYKVLLHNDDVNEMGHVVLTIRKLTPLTLPQAVERMLEAHTRGVSLLLVTHKERAELYVEQFASCSITVTMEPDG